MTRSEFIKLMVSGALGACSRLSAQALTVTPADADLWQPVPDLPPAPNIVTSPAQTRFENHGPGLGNRIALTFD
ncbi:MAG: hypothetical protein LBD30_04530, partial [Verrucomicrobiales bacterium]|nr:hypothetical protein [Verrucomicrobiales bacterium]